MVQGPGAPDGYDWDGESIPGEAEPLALPDHGRGTAPAEPAVAELAPPTDGPYGAPSFTYEAQAARETPPRRRGTLTPWSIVAIVAVQAAALVGVVALLVGGVQHLVAPPPAPSAAPSAPPPSQTPAPTADPSAPREPGTVTDSAGREVTDGTGASERPARVGEHTVSWSTWTEGTLSVSALAVELDADPPGADGRSVGAERVLQDGFRLVTATYEVAYDGPGQLAPAEELWLTGESARSYYPDVAEGLLPDPMKAVPPLQSGEAATFRSAFLVPESEVDGFLLTVETYSGEPAYYATP